MGIFASRADMKTSQGGRTGIFASRANKRDIVIVARIEKRPHSTLFDKQPQARWLECIYRVHHSPMGRRFLEENRGNAVVAINYLPTHRKTLYGYGILLPYPLTTRFYGDEFIDARLCALKKDYARNSEKKAGFLITLLNKNGRVAEGVAQQLLKGIVELASSNSAVRELYGVLPPALVPVAEGLGMIIKQLENQAAQDRKSVV